MVPYAYPPQQKKTETVVALANSLAKGKAAQETIARQLAEKAGSEAEDRLMRAVAKSVRLVNEDLLRDIEVRDMQFVWGIFSAIPVRYPREEILSHPMPDFWDTDGRSRCLREHLLPQHPLAFLEIYSEDSSTVTVIAPQPEILRPLYGLDCWTEDAEEQNRRFLALEAVTERLVRERGYGAMDAYARRNLASGSTRTPICWWALTRATTPASTRSATIWPWSRRWTSSRPSPTTPISSDRSPPPTPSATCTPWAASPSCA